MPEATEKSSETFEYDPASLPSILPIYYKLLFPFGTYYSWLSYGGFEKSQMANREFSFTLKDDIYIRYQSFTNQQELEREIQKVLTRAKKNMFNEEDHVATNPHRYGTMNIMVEGFDMVVVEKFTQHIHRLVLKHKIKVPEVYALPTAFVSVKHVLNEFTSNVNEMQNIADLPWHGRVVQVYDMEALTAPILTQTLAKQVPPGVKLSMHEYKEEDFMRRHNENAELKEAQKDYRKLRFGK